MKLTPIDYNGGQIWVDRPLLTEGKNTELIVASDRLIRTGGEIIQERQVVAQSINLNLPNIPYVEIEEEDDTVYVPDLRNSDVKGKLYLQSKGASLKSNVPEYKPSHLLDAYKEGFEDGIYHQRSKAASAKKYTEEDLRKAIKETLSYKVDSFVKDKPVDLHDLQSRIIQSLQPKVVSIEIELEPEWCWVNGERFEVTDKEDKEEFIPKTYQKDGKTFLKVKSFQYAK